MRYEEDLNAKKLVDDTVARHFGHLVNAKIAVLMDTKSKKSKGRLVFGTLRKTNPIIRVLTDDGGAVADGYDYVLVLDKFVFNAIDDADKVRIIRHELSHASVDGEKEQPYDIQNHEVEDFFSEIEYNRDDPRWTERVTAVAESMLEEEKERNKKPRGRKKGSKNKRVE
jgi:hypothetical protein